MSDDHGDADFEASLANLDPGADGGDPADGDDASIEAGDRGSAGSRLDSIQGTLSTLGMRIDALVTSTTSYRTALTDRLTEYSELVVKTGRNQATDLDEYRKTTERAVAEVHESMRAAEEAVTRIDARLDELGSGSDADTAESRRAVAEIRNLFEAQERLSEFLTESLDRFGAKVVDHVDERTDALAAQVAVAVAAAERAAEAKNPVAADLAALGADIGAVRAAVADLADGGEDPAVAGLVGQIETLEAALGAVGNQVGGLRADLRANMIDAVSEAGIAQQHAEVERLLTELQETLLDVASGEVVGALWDEVRSLRSSLESATASAADGDEGGDPLADAVVARMDALQASLGALASEVRGLSDLVDTDDVDDAAEAEDTTGPRLDALQSSVAALATEVRTLLDAVEVDEDVATGSAATDETAAAAVSAEQVDNLAAEVASVADQLASFRDELATGLVVEPAVSLVDDIAGLRSAVEEVHARLDEGLVLAADDLPSAPSTDAPAQDGAVDRLADQVASLRDLVTTRLADLQSQLASGGAGTDDGADPAEAVEFVVDVAPFEEAVTALRDEIRSLTGTAETAEPAAAPAEVGLDADVVDLLREEIRSAGGVSDAVVEALRDELKALRRRIAVKADEKVLDEAQLAQIADAVAARLETEN